MSEFANTKTDRRSSSSLSLTVLCDMIVYIQIKQIAFIARVYQANQ